MIIRSHKREYPYVNVDKTIVDDKRLSFKAKGIAVYLLGRPDNWKANSNHLASIGPDGRTAILSGLNELEAAGYLVRHRERDENGQFVYSATLYERPRNVENPESGFPTLENPTSGNHDIISNEVISNEVISNETTTTTTSSGGGNQQDNFELPQLKHPNEHTRLCNLMQDNGFGFVSEILRSDLDEALDKYPAVEIDAAIRIAVRKGKPFWSYVNGILRKGVNSTSTPGNGKSERWVWSPPPTYTEEELREMHDAEITF